MANTHSDGGFEDLTECVKYAKELREDIDVMSDPKTGRYHAIRLFGSTHWQQHYKLIAQVRVVMHVEFM